MIIKNRVEQYYKLRFQNKEIPKRNQIWKTLCLSFFQRYVSTSDTLLDIGAGYCEFINNINCYRKIAVDINPSTKKFANKNIEILQVSALSIPSKLHNKIDVIFVSNFLEHLNSKKEVVTFLMNCRKILKENGTLLLLQPNISLVKEAYWDFIDHTVPLNTNSIKEVLEITGFKIEIFIEKFLPYTTKQKFLPQNDIFIKIYLKLPYFLRFFAGQSFVLARK